MKKQILYLSMFLLVGLLLTIYQSSYSQDEGDIDISPDSTMVQDVNQATGNDFWTFRGPQHNLQTLKGPQINTLVIHPTNHNIVYAGTNQGVYRSINGGESWLSKNEGLGSFGDLVIASIAIDPTNPSRMLLATWGSGVWQSTNAGDRWVRLPDPLASTLMQSYSIEIEAPIPPPMEMTGLGYSYRYRGASSASLYPEGLPIVWQRTAVRCITMNPQTPTELFACIDDGQGLYQSSNGGLSWQKIDYLGQGSALTFTFAPSNHQIRYASFGSWSVSGGFYRTNNGGGVWTQVGTGIMNSPVIAVAIHPTNANIVLAATSGDGLFRSDDGGISWVKVSLSLQDTIFYSVRFVPNNPDIVYAGGEEKFYRSVDGGINWSIADNALTAQEFTALAVHPSQPDTVWLGSGSDSWGGVYKRTSSDQPFAFRSVGMQDTFVLDVESDPTNASRVYAATWGAGAYRSTNGGLTWTKMTLPPYVFDIESATTSLLYATTFYEDYGIFKSTDRGATWVEVSNIAPSNVSFDIETIFNNNNRLVAATISGVQYSSDGGVTWFTATTLDASKGLVLRICEFRGTGKLLAATYGGGVFYSSGGSVWYEANTGLLTQTNSEYTFDVACSQDVPGLAYVAGLKVSKTTNYGETWHPMDTNLPNEYFRGIDIARETGDVFVASNTKGVYVAPNGGPIWAQINTGLLELNTRAIKVITPTPASSPAQIMVGTNGLGIWDYTLIDRPFATSVYLPLVSNGASQQACSSYEPNDSFAQATVLQRPDKYCSFIETETDEDFYRFNVATLGPIQVDLGSIPTGTNYELELFDSNRNLMAGSYNSGNTAEQIVFYPARTGAHFIRVYPVSWNDAAAELAYHLELAYDGNPGTGTIQGSVNQSGSLIPNIPVRVDHTSGFGMQTMIAQSDSNGIYRFRGMGPLPVGHTYRVYYWNLSNDPQKLSSWDCGDNTNYLANPQQPLCSFDIANVFAISPSHDITTTLPVTFTWSNRGVSGDNYQLRLRSFDGSKLWISDPLGDSTTYTLNMLPPGFVFGETYYWDVVVRNAGGIGYAYYAHAIKFSATAAASGLVSSYVIRNYPSTMRLLEPTP